MSYLYEHNLNSVESFLGGADPGSLRIADDIAITDAYQYSSWINISQAKSMLIGFILDANTNTACNIKFEFSDDNPGSAESYPLGQINQAGTITLLELDLGGDDITIGLPIANPGARFMRVGFKGTASDGTLRVTVGRGNGSGLPIHLLQA